MNNNYSITIMTIFENFCKKNTLGLASYQELPIEREANEIILDLVMMADDDI